MPTTKVRDDGIAWSGPGADPGSFMCGASKRQHVIIISGRGEFEVIGGKKVQLAPES